MITFKSYAEAYNYYKRAVENQREVLLKELKHLRELEALAEHNKKLMYKYEADDPEQR